MNKITHKIWIAFLTFCALFTLIYLSIKGYEYYSTSLAERFFHDSHEILKPSGAFGHGYGIIGSLLILFGVFGYMARKRYRFLFRLGQLKHWLEFHIFLCVEGSILILFHTSFKFGGIVSISFWSMVIVVLSGVIGRFIYIQIPRNIEGQELSLSELILQKNNFGQLLKERFSLSEEIAKQIILVMDSGTNGNKLQKPNYLNLYISGITQKRNIRKTLTSEKIHKKYKSEILRIIDKELTLNRKIALLQSMKRLFKLWHVAHLPFALIMLLIMIIHVIITLLFGYKWIF